jgi:hypothetical protein
MALICAISCPVFLASPACVVLSDRPILLEQPAGLWSLFETWSRQRSFGEPANSGKGEGERELVFM